MTSAMNVLMFVNRSDDEVWPSAEAIDRFFNRTADDDDETGTAMVFAYRPGTVVDDEAFLDVVAQRFHLARRRRLLLLTGVRYAPTLAERLYRERAVPVDVVFLAPAEDGRELFRTTAGVTHMYGWRPPRDDADVVVSAICFANAVSDGYRTYTERLRDIQTAVVAAVDDEAYASVMDAFGDGVRAVEPVLDAVLEQLCGRDLQQQTAADGDRWMSTIVEYGDRAAGDSLSFVDATIAADYVERTTRTAISFAATFWRDYAGRPTATDRALAQCLIENLKAAAADSPDRDFSDEHFAIAMHAKFIGTRRWCHGDAPSVDNASSPTFQPEIRELCERFLAVGHLMDLMVADCDGMLRRSHVEHLESYVLPQRLVEYASRHFRYQVRYFALTDTLVFRFTDGERGQLVERYCEHRLTGPRNLKEFHDELYRTDNFIGSVNVAICVIKIKNLHTHVRP